jgi:hypothetical protein
LKLDQVVENTYILLRHQRLMKNKSYLQRKMLEKFSEMLEKVSEMLEKFREMNELCNVKCVNGRR